MSREIDGTYGFQLHGIVRRRLHEQIVQALDEIWLCKIRHRRWGNEPECRTTRTSMAGGKGRKVVKSSRRDTDNTRRKPKGTLLKTGACKILAEFSRAT